jgi:hypothetical protein
MIHKLTLTTSYPYTKKLNNRDICATTVLPFWHKCKDVDLTQIEHNSYQAPSTNSQPNWGLQPNRIEVICEGAVTVCDCPRELLDFHYVVLKLL